MKKMKIPLTVDFYGAIIKNILRLWITVVNEDQTVIDRYLKIFKCLSKVITGNPVITFFYSNQIVPINLSKAITVMNVIAFFN